MSKTIIEELEKIKAEIEEISQLEYWKNGQYDTIREAKIDEDVIPDNCLLYKANWMQDKEEI